MTQSSKDSRSASLMASVLVTALLLGAFAACNHQLGSTNLVDLVPADAIAVVRLQWSAVRDDRGLRQFAPVAEVATAIKQLGLPSTATDSIVVFSRTFGSPASADTAIFRAPGFAQQVVRGVADRGWLPASANGVTVYRDPRSGVALVALSQDVVVVGPSSSVEQVLRTVGDAGLSLIRRPEFVDLSQTLRGAEPIAMALIWPQAAQDASRAAIAMSAQVLRFAGWGPLGTLVEKFGVGRALTAACSREVGGVRLSLTGLMQDESAATLVTGGLTLLKSLAGLVPSPSASGPSPADLASLTVDRHGALVGVTMLVADQRR